MDEFWAYISEFNFASVALRLLLAMASGCVIGYGRARKHRPAGMRTYMLTSVGAALAVLISLYENEMLACHWGALVPDVEIKFDVARLSAQVISGIGFLGAGTIIAVAHNQTYGLTSAAGMFVTVCLGIAAGIGFYECVFIALIMAVIVLDIMPVTEALFRRRIRNMTIFIEFESLDDVGDISDAIGQKSAMIYDIDLERTERSGKKLPSAVFSMRLDKSHSSHSEMLSTLAELPCVHSIQELFA